MEDNKPVAVGQIWASTDKRTMGWFTRVEAIDGNRAICRRVDAVGMSLTNRTTRIRLDRFKPGSTGYCYISG